MTLRRRTVPKNHPTLNDTVEVPPDRPRHRGSGHRNELGIRIWVSGRSQWLKVVIAALALGTAILHVVAK